MRRDGFTLVELVVAIAVLSIVMAMVTQSFVVQNRAYTVTGQVVDAQQNLRTIGHLVEHDIRMAGFMVPEAAALCAVDNQNAPDSLYVSDSDAISAVNQVKAQLGARITAGYSVALAAQTLTVDNVVLDGQPYYDNNNDGVPDSDFRVNSGVIVADATNPALGVGCGIVTSIVPPSTLTVDFKATMPVPPLGDRLIVVPAHVYTVGAAVAGGPTTNLLRDGLLLASDIEDFQVSFFFDTNRDGQMTPAENPGVAGGNPYLSSVWDNRVLREVRFDVVGRTSLADPRFPDGQFQTTENRAPVAGNDGYRRRVHTGTVRVRNVGFRGTAS